MITIVDDRSPVKSASIAFLRHHIHYLSDPFHEDHKDKIKIHPPKFVNLKTPTEEGFIQAVIDADNAYRAYRSGKKGKRTARLWDETIYRSPDKSGFDEADRADAERTVLSINPGEPAFLQWHEDGERDSWDLHKLNPAKSISWPYQVVLSSIFGGGKKHIFAEFELLDDELVECLNERRSADRRILSARKTRKKKAKEFIGKVPSLAQQIAEKVTGKITQKDLPRLIKSIGLKDTKVSERFIAVLFEGRKRRRRYAIDTLINDVNDIQQSNPGNLG